MKKIMRSLLVSCLLVCCFASFAFAAGVPIFDFGVPSGKVQRGDLFNVTLDIKATAVSGMAADWVGYKITGGMFAVEYPAIDLECVNAPELNPLIAASGFKITSFSITGNKMTFMLDRAVANVAPTPFTLSTTMFTNFVTLTFRANRNSSLDEVEAEIVVPKDDNLIGFGDGDAKQPTVDEKDTIIIAKDGDTGGDGLDPLRTILSNVVLEYPVAGSHETILTAYFRQGTGYTSNFPGVVSLADGSFKHELPTIPVFNFNYGVKRLNSLVAGFASEVGVMDHKSKSLLLIEGDLNADNVINDTDYAILNARINYSIPSYGVGLTGDLNNDGAVDILDKFIFNGTIVGLGEGRYLKTGFNMESTIASTFSTFAVMSMVDTANAMLAASESVSTEGTLMAAANAPTNPIIRINSLGANQYEIELTKATPLITTIQVAIDGTNVGTFDLGTLPVDWDTQQQGATASGRTFFKGNMIAGGTSMSAGVIATFTCDDAPAFRWDGDSPTRMSLATSTGEVLDVSFEDTDIVPDPGSDDVTPTPTTSDDHVCSGDYYYSYYNYYHNSSEKKNGCTSIPVGMAALLLVAPAIMVYRKKK